MIQDYFLFKINDQGVCFIFSEEKHDFLKVFLQILLVKHVKFKQAATDINFHCDLVYSLDHIVPFGGWTTGWQSSTLWPSLFFAFPAHNSFQIYSLHMLKELNSIFLIYLLRKSIILYHLPTVSHIVMRRIDVQMSLSLFFCLTQVKCWCFQCLWAYIILRYIVSCTPLIIAGMFCLTNLPIYISCIPFCG